MLKNQLLPTHAAPVLLHGDLHQENILANGEDWAVIDPKGVIGAPIHEIWALVEDPKNDLVLLSKTFDLPFDEVVKWYYVRLVLAACWRVEDGLDPKLFLDLADFAPS
jgi:streptomycin 6-kinase